MGASQAGNRGHAIARRFGRRRGYGGVGSGVEELRQLAEVSEAAAISCDVPSRDSAVVPVGGLATVRERLDIAVTAAATDQ